MPDSTKTLVNSLSWLTALSLAIILLIARCSTVPPVTVSAVYMGNSADQTLYGNKNEEIKCSDPKFDTLVCISQKDFEALVSGNLNK